MGASHSTQRSQHHIASPRKWLNTHPGVVITMRPLMTRLKSGHCRLALIVAASAAATMLADCANPTSLLKSGCAISPPPSASAAAYALQAGMQGQAYGPETLYATGACGTVSSWSISAGSL